MPRLKSAGHTPFFGVADGREGTRARLVIWAYPLRFCKVYSQASANLMPRASSEAKQRHQDDNLSA